MIEMKWVGLIMLIVTIWLAIKSNQLKDALVSFIVGSLYGFSLDVVVGSYMGTWSYVHPIWSFRYFLLVVPGWGIFGMTINIIWNIMKNKPWMVLLNITAGLIVLLEGVNFLTKTWTYYVPLWIMVIGWFPLVLTY